MIAFYEVPTYRGTATDLPASCVYDGTASYLPMDFSREYRSTRWTSPDPTQPISEPEPMTTLSDFNAPIVDQDSLDEELLAWEQASDEIDLDGFNESLEDDT